MEGMTGAPWRKSSYSTGNGGNCVEVATWRKATYSTGNGGACIEAGVAEPAGSWSGTLPTATAARYVHRDRVAPFATRLKYA